MVPEPGRGADVFAGMAQQFKASDMRIPFLNTGQSGPGTVRILGISFVALLSLSVVFVAVLSFLVVYLQDRNAIAASEKLVRGDLDKRLHAMSVQLLDNGYWDQAVDNVITIPNPAWIAEEFGAYLYSTSHMSRVQIFDGADRRVVLIDEGELQDDPGEAVFGPGEKALIAAARATEDDAEPVVAAGYVQSGEDVMMAAAIRMTTYVGDADRSTDHVMVFSRRMDADFLTGLESDNLVRSMRWSGGDGGFRRGSTPVAFYGGSGGRWLSWRSDLPGTDMIPALLAGLFAFVAVVLAIGLIFTRRIGEHARQLDEARTAAERASQMKSEFLTHMSHELRTPLNAVLGFSDLMRRQHLGPLGDARYMEYLNDIHASGEHLLALVNGLLDLTRIEAGRLDIQAETLAVAGLAAESVEMLRPLAAEKDIALSWSVENEGLTVLADDRSLRQILINLLGNAVKFTPPGGEVACRARARRDGSVEITVTDTGIGIGAADLPRVLEPFMQVGAAQTEGQKPGTGLGLPLARKLAELMGGTLDIESEPGRGTAVTVVLPAGAAPQGAGMRLIA